MLKPVDILRVCIGEKTVGRLAMAPARWMGKFAARPVADPGRNSSGYLNTARPAEHCREFRYGRSNLSSGEPIE